AAAAAPPLPEEVPTAPARPRSRTRLKATEAILALNDPVGLRSSAFTQSRSSPIRAPMLAETSIAGVSPSPRLTTWDRSVTGSRAWWRHIPVRTEDAELIGPPPVGLH